MAANLKPFHFPRSKMLLTFEPSEKGVRVALVERVIGPDGKLDTQPTWFSSELTPAHLHALRDRVDAAMEAATEGGADGDA